jgi:hypothetical protein
VRVSAEEVPSAPATVKVIVPTLPVRPVGFAMEKLTVSESKDGLQTLVPAVQPVAVNTVLS